MKNKKVIWMIVEVVVIAILAFFIINAGNSKLELQTAYVFNANIDDFGREIAETDIKEVEVPGKGVIGNLVTDKEEIIGKHLDRKVDKGQFVYKEMLVETEAVDIFKTMDMTGMRKISLPINFVEGMSGNIKKGDKVDLAYVGAGATEESDFFYSKIFLQNIPVWSVNTADGYKFMDRSDVINNSEDESYKEMMGEGDLNIITLAVTLEQYEEIKAREAAGNISFVGRFNDSEDYETMGFVMGDYEKIFTGQGYAETGKILLEDLENLDKMEKDAK